MRSGFWKLHIHQVRPLRPIARHPTILFTNSPPLLSLTSFLLSLSLLACSLALESLDLLFLSLSNLSDLLEMI